MKTLLKRRAIAFGILAVLLIGLAQSFRPTEMTASGVAVEQAVAPDPVDRPLALNIWYPTALGQPGRIREGRLPLIVISHGTGGSGSGHVDTAIALAKAGFVVAAVTHSGDNYRDDSYVGKGTHLIGRSRHVARVIDYMQSKWPHRDAVDASRIGIFGHSAGGFTALVDAGGEPDPSRSVAYCRERPNDWGCNYVRRHGHNPDKLVGQQHLTWVHDPRVKAIAIAAPALGYMFQPEGLAHVKVPVQIWEAQRDVIVNDSATVIRRMLPDGTEYHLVANAGHFSFLMPCSRQMSAMIAVMSIFGTEKVCDDPAGFDRAKFHETFNTEIVQFFHRTLGSEAR